MTALAVTLAIACLALGLLLVCALVGASQQADALLACIDSRDARIEGLENELRHHQRRNHPAGRGLSGTPTFDALATERHLAEVRRLPTRGDAG